MTPASLEEIAPGVLVVTSRRMSTTSTVIVGRAGDALLVDPAWMPDELESLSAAASALRAASVTMDTPISLLP